MQGRASWARCGAQLRCTQWLFTRVGAGEQSLPLPRRQFVKTCCPLHASSHGFADSTAGKPVGRCTHERTHAHTRTRARAHTHTHTHTCTHVHTHTHMHTHTNTHAHAPTGARATWMSWPMPSAGRTRTTARPSTRPRRAASLAARLRGPRWVEGLGAAVTDRHLRGAHLQRKAAAAASPRTA
mgnify:CR=1 FL=1